MSEISRILESLEPADPTGAAQLLPLVYDELRNLARARMAAERSGHTLQATALVHEAWIKLAGAKGECRHWNGRRHFYAAASEAMRQILIDYARRKQAVRRGGDLLRVTLGDHEAPYSASPDEIIDLDEAMEKLMALDPKKAEVAKLRLFCGLTAAETATVLGVAKATIARRWSYAKAWLSRELNRDHP